MPYKPLNTFIVGDMHLIGEQWMAKSGWNFIER